MGLIYVVIWGFVIVAGISSVSALVWGVQNGQLRGTREDALTIFELDDTTAAAPSRPDATRLSTRGD